MILFNDCYCKLVLLFQINTNGYVVLGDKTYDRNQPTSWDLLFLPRLKAVAEASGFAIVAPLWTDNDISFHNSTVTYQQYDKNLRFGSQSQTLVNDILAEVRSDVFAFTPFSDFRISWAMIITWKNMYPRVFFDPSKDTSVSRDDIFYDIRTEKCEE